MKVRLQFENTIPLSKVAGYPFFIWNHKPLKCTFERSLLYIRHAIGFKNPDNMTCCMVFATDTAFHFGKTAVGLFILTKPNLRTLP